MTVMENFRLATDPPRKEESTGNPAKDWPSILVSLWKQGWNPKAFTTGRAARDDLIRTLWDAPSGLGYSSSMIIEIINAKERISCGSMLNAATGEFIPWIYDPNDDVYWRVKTVSCNSIEKRLYHGVCYLKRLFQRMMVWTTKRKPVLAGWNYARTREELIDQICREMER